MPWPRRSRWGPSAAPVRPPMASTLPWAPHLSLKPHVLEQALQALLPPIPPSHAPVLPPRVPLPQGCASHRCVQHREETLAQLMNDKVKGQEGAG